MRGLARSPKLETPADGVMSGGGSVSANGGPLTLALSPLGRGVERTPSTGHRSERESVVLQFAVLVPGGLECLELGGRSVAKPEVEAPVIVDDGDEVVDASHGIAEGGLLEHSSHQTSVRRRALAIR